MVDENKKRQDALEREADKRIQNISNVTSSVAARAEAAAKRAQDLEVQERYGTAKGARQAVSSIDRVLKNLGSATEALAIGVKNITAETARGVKQISVGAAGAVGEYAKAVGEDINWNKGAFVTTTLGRITPLLGYAVAKMMETTVFRNMIAKMKAGINKALGAVAFKFKQIAMVGWEKGKEFVAGIRDLFSRKRGAARVTEAAKREKEAIEKAKRAAPKMQRGGYVKKGGLAEIHSGEVVQSKQDVAGFKRLATVIASGFKIFQKKSLDIEQKLAMQPHVQKNILGDAVKDALAEKQGRGAPLERIAEATARIATIVNPFRLISTIWQNFLARSPFIRAFNRIGVAALKVVALPITALFKRRTSGLRLTGNPFVDMGSLLGAIHGILYTELDTQTRHLNDIAEATTAMAQKEGIKIERTQARKASATYTWAGKGIKWLGKQIGSGLGWMFGEDSPFVKFMTKERSVGGGAKWMGRKAGEAVKWGGRRTEEKLREKYGDKAWVDYISKQRTVKGGLEGTRDWLKEKTWGRVGKWWDERKKRKKNVRTLEKQLYEFEDLHKTQKRSLNLQKDQYLRQRKQLRVARASSKKLGSVATRLKSGKDWFMNLFTKIGMGIMGIPKLLGKFWGIAKGLKSMTSFFNLVSKVGPLKAILGVGGGIAAAGAAGYGVGTLLNKLIIEPYIVKPLVKGSEERAKRSTKQHVTGIREAQDLISRYQLGEEVDKEKVIKARTMISASAQMQGMKAKRRKDFGSLTRSTLFDEIESAQDAYFVENFDRYAGYGSAQLTRLRAEWLEKGGFGGKGWTENATEYGRRREEAFLKYVESKGKKLSKEKLETQARGALTGEKYLLSRGTAAKTRKFQKGLADYLPIISQFAGSTILGVGSQAAAKYLENNPEALVKVADSILKMKRDQIDPNIIAAAEFIKSNPDALGALEKGDAIVQQAKATVTEKVEGAKQKVKAETTKRYVAVQAWATLKENGQQLIGYGGAMGIGHRGYVQALKIAKAHARKQVLEQAKGSKIGAVNYTVVEDEAFAKELIAERRKPTGTAMDTAIETAGEGTLVAAAEFGKSARKATDKAVATVKESAIKAKDFAADAVKNPTVYYRMLKERVFDGIDVLKGYVANISDRMTGVWEIAKARYEHEIGQLPKEVVAHRGFKGMATKGTPLIRTEAGEFIEITPAGEVNEALRRQGVSRDQVAALGAGRDIMRANMTSDMISGINGIRGAVESGTKSQAAMMSSFIDNSTQSTQVTNVNGGGGASGPGGAVFYGNELNAVLSGNLT